MSEQPHNIHENASPAAAAAGTTFTGQEVEEFSEDDARAGANIGKMLVLFFTYSLIVGIFVSWWAFHAMS